MCITMKKFLSFLIRLPLWKPATSFMRNLLFPFKMLLISIVFVTPTLWLLVTFTQVRLQDLHLLERERQGVHYAMTVYPALDAVGMWRFQARSAAWGDVGIQPDKALHDFEDAFKKIESTDTQFGMSAERTATLDKARTAMKVAQSAVLNTSDTASQNMMGVSLALIDLLDQVTDVSGLAVDPEPSSTYLISSVLTQSPAIIQSIAELRGLGGGAFRSGKLTPEIAARIQERLAVLEHVAHVAKADLDKVQNMAPDYKSSVSRNADASVVNFAALVRATFPVGLTDVSGDRVAFVTAANQALQTQFTQIAANLAVLDTMLAERQSLHLRLLWLTLIGSLASMALALYLFMGFYCSMSGGFKIVRRHLINIAMGDLRAVIHGAGRDEVAGLLKELSHMQRSLIDTVQQVQDASSTVVQSSIQIARGMQDLSHRSEAAAAALEESSAALEQTTTTVQSSAESVRQASEIAADNAKTASLGGQVMADVMDTMEGIHASSKKISDIIGVIDGIAFQTNILALNAAVEAARAGEQGRGFAVVATEVRALAGRSAQAAQEIKTLIAGSTAQVSMGSEVVRKAGITMNDIVEKTDQVRQLLDQVANGAREQSIGIVQIGQVINELDLSTQANATLVEQTASAASLQQHASVRMAAQVDEFRLPGHIASAMVEGIDVDTIIDGHRQWKVKLREAIESNAKVDVSVLCRDDCCALGKWIYADGQRLRERTTFMDLVGKHAHFHKVAGQVGELINQERYEQAQDALASGTPFSVATSEVVLVLSSIKRLGFE